MTTTIPENTPLGVMLKAFDLGLHMEAQDGKLLVWPDALLTPGMRSELTRWKWRIMYLLAIRFVIVYSETLGRTVFFAEDESAKDALIVAGAEEPSIYTLEEIEHLAKANRESAITGKELCLLSEAKTVFNGRFTEHQ
jgi:hypothetical protein